MDAVLGVGPPISSRGYCADCGIARLEASVLDMACKSGPDYEKWRRGMHSFAQRLLDATSERPRQ